MLYIKIKSNIVYFQSFSFLSPYGSQKLYNNTYNFTILKYKYLGTKSQLLTACIQVYNCFRYAAILFKKQKYVSGQHKVSIIILFRTRYHPDLILNFYRNEGLQKLEFQQV